MEIFVALALLLVLSIAIHLADRTIAAGSERKSPANKDSLPFARILSRDEHWYSATTVVKRSVERVGTIVNCQQSAACQIEAAEYALHCLLGELSDVMAMAIVSPLQHRPATADVRLSPLPMSLAA